MTKEVLIHLKGMQTTDACLLYTSSDLYKAVGSLKEDLRMPVILYYIENFNIREIAQIMDISEGAVQKRLARARGKLRQDLQESEAWT